MEKSALPGVEAEKEDEEKRGEKAEEEEMGLRHVWKRSRLQCSRTGSSQILRPPPSAQAFAPLEAPPRDPPLPTHLASPLPGSFTFPDFTV